MTIMDQIRTCPLNMVDILELRVPVADYMEAIINLYSLDIMNKEQTDKILSEVEQAYKERVRIVRNINLN